MVMCAIVVSKVTALSNRKATSRDIKKSIVVSNPVSTIILFKNQNMDRFELVIDIVNHIFQNDFIELILAVQYYMVRQDNNAHLYFGHFT